MSYNSIDPATATEHVVDLLTSQATINHEWSKYTNAARKHKPLLRWYRPETGAYANTPDKLARREEVRASSEYKEALKAEAFLSSVQNLTQFGMKYTDTPSEMRDGRETGLGLTVYVPSTFATLAECKNEDDERRFLTNLGNSVLDKQASNQGVGVAMGRGSVPSPCTVVRDVSSVLHNKPAKPLMMASRGDQSSPLQSFVSSYADVTTTEGAEAIYDAAHPKVQMALLGPPPEGAQWTAENPHGLDVSWSGEPDGIFGTSVNVTGRGLNARDVEGNLRESQAGVEELKSKCEKDGVSDVLIQSCGANQVSIGVPSEIQSNIQSIFTSAMSKAQEEGNTFDWQSVDFLPALENDYQKTYVGSQDPTGKTPDSRKADVSHLTLVLWDKSDGAGGKIVQDADSFWPKGKNDNGESIITVISRSG
ncbi:hypothetical protein IAT38_008434 [Cryptococcus sp. DSM 104549]